LPCVRWFWQTL
jgi:pyru_phos_dikin: pyruvate, phosphate dikinase